MIKWEVPLGHPLIFIMIKNGRCSQRQMIFLLLGWMMLELSPATTAAKAIAATATDRPKLAYLFQSLLQTVLPTITLPLSCSLITEHWFNSSPSTSLTQHPALLLWHGIESAISGALFSTCVYQHFFVRFAVCGCCFVCWYRYHQGAPQDFPWEVDIESDGALGAHGGSGLSALGGSIRLGCAPSCPSSIASFLWCFILTYVWNASYVIDTCSHRFWFFDILFK